MRGVLVAALLLAVSAPADARCPAHPNVLLQNHRALLYRANHETYGCYRPSGRTTELTGPGWGAQFPPALDLAGTWSAAAYTDDFWDNTLAIDAINLRDPDHVAYAVDAQAGNVGSVGVTANGTVAWIACPDALGAFGDPRECGHGRHQLYEVFIHTPDRRWCDRDRPVDTGHRIDPFSLRIRDGVAVWRHYGIQQRHTMYRHTRFTRVCDWSPAP